MDKRTTLICKAISYYSSFDEDLFFDWIKKIPSIKNYDGKHDKLYLHLENSQISDDDLRELLALFYRYKIKNMPQLQIFLHESNRAWFAENKKAFWHKKTFDNMEN